MKNKFLYLGSVMAFTVTFFGCSTEPAKAIKVMSDHGFVDVTVLDSGVAWAAYHGCAEKDGEWYEVQAKNPLNKTVTMTVCCGGGWLHKACTIRSE